MYKRESDCRHQESIRYDYTVNRTHGLKKSIEKKIVLIGVYDKRQMIERKCK